MRNQIPLLLALTVAPGVASAATLQATTASSVSTGRYGGVTSTRVAATTFGVSGDLGGWSLGVNVPYMVVDSGGSAAFANGVIIRARGNRQLRRGYGDAQVRVGGPLAPSANLPVELRLEGTIKVPTGSKQLSTGKTDGSISIEMSRTVGAVTPYAAVTYRVYGDSRQLTLADGFSVAAGAAVTRKNSIFMLTYERSHSPVRGRASQELFAVAVTPLSKDLNLSVYGSRGLNSGAADLMVGLATTFRFGGRNRVR